MDRKYVKQIGEFTAQSADGRKWPVNVLQEFIEGQTSDSPFTVARLKRLVTDDGRSVDMEEKGRYQLIGHPNTPNLRRPKRTWA